MDKIQHMAPNHLQGIPGNVVFLCAQEKKIEFINIEQVTHIKNKLHNDKVFRFPSITAKSSSQLHSRIHLYVYIFFILMKKTQEQLAQKKGLYYQHSERKINP